MHPQSNDKPTQAQLVFPILETLHARGGSASAIDVASALAERFDLPESVTSATTVAGDGQVIDLWRRHVRYAKQKAKEMGYVTSDGRGADWKLTDVGFKGLRFAQPAVMVEVLRAPDGTPRAARINLCVGLPTTHLITQGDARHLGFIDDNAIPLCVTSVPYFDLKHYGNDPGQLAEITSYEAFVDAMEAVLREIQRVLIPGGRLALNVGDILRSRAQHGEHHLLPLHAHLLTRATNLGFRNLTGILWHKRSNATYEEKGAGVFGKPGQPNGVIKAELEHILLLKKPGPYRAATPAQQRDSFIAKEDYTRLFRPIWDDVPGARTDRGHPAPYPLEIPRRLITMFSFAGDTVLDPFAGSGTTALAAAKAGRHSVNGDISPQYVARSIERVSRGDIELARVA